MLEYFGLHLLGFLEDNLTKGSQKLHPGDIFCEFDIWARLAFFPLSTILCQFQSCEKRNEINPSDNKLKTVHYLNPILVRCGERNSKWRNDYIIVKEGQVLAVGLLQPKIPKTRHPQELSVATDVPNPIRSRGLMYLPTWMADFLW